MLASSVTFLAQFLGALPKALWPLCETRPKAPKARRWRPSPPRIPAARRRSRRPPADARPPSRTPRALPLPTIFFSAPSQAPEHPAHGRLAHRDTGYPPQVLAAFGKGGRGALFHVASKILL